MKFWIGEDRGDSSISSTRMPSVTWSVILVFVCVTSSGFGDDQTGPPDSEQPPKEIRQGTYVEIVEPGVDYRDRLPRTAPLEPAESLKRFHLIPGFRIELAASEPLIRDPVDVAFNEHGRMYVAELITYSESRHLLTGQVSVLEDTDNDGLYDTSRVLVDKLGWPSGLLCFDGGVFVASPPDVLYCKDTDGDGKADIRHTVVTGFEDSSPNQCANSLRWTLDNRVELMSSNAGGVLRAVEFEKTEAGKGTAPLQIRGRDLSFHPRTGQMRPESGGAQYGATFDAWGRKFESSNSDPIDMIMYEDRYVARNPYLEAPSGRIPIWADGMTVYRTSPVEPWRIIRTEMRVRGFFSGPIEGGGTPAGYFTSACGIMICQNDTWPQEFQGNAFVCEGAGNLVHRMKLEPNGVALSARRTEAEHEFLTSDEVWFKPVQIHNAPDGSLYIVDMYREIFEHPDAVPPSVRRHIDLNTGNDRGRIYRIVPDGYQRPTPIDLATKSSVDLVAYLSHSNVHFRTTASRLLYERQDQRSLVPLIHLATTGEPAVGRMHAMYALAGMNALNEEILAAGLKDTHPRVREHSVRLAEPFLSDSPSLRAALFTLVDDPDKRVRYQLAFTLGGIQTDQATDALTSIARRDGSDRWVRFAILTSSLGRAGTLLARLTADTTWQTKKETWTLAELLAEQAGRQNREDQIAEVIHYLEKLEGRESDFAQVVVRGLTRGLSKSNSPLLQTLNSAEGSRAGEILAGMIEKATTCSLDDEIPITERAEAIRSLALASFDHASDVLVELLDSRQSQAIQTAAIRTLSRFDEPAVADMIIEGWMGFSPSVRGEAAEALFARNSRITALLQAVDDQSIAPSQLDPARIEFLRTHPEDSIRNEAERLFAGARVARREDVLKAYQDCLQLNADAQNGKEVFRRECAQCHKLEGIGYDLGLPLQNVKTRGADGILMQIIDPNREVNPAYLNYLVLTEQGRLYTGIIRAETATSITLSRAEGENDSILRTDIDEMRSTDLSIMPEGLEDKVSKQEMADLIGYLLHVAE